jgi:hypothetical protein
MHISVNEKHEKNFIFSLSTLDRSDEAKKLSHATIPLSAEYMELAVPLFIKSPGHLFQQLEAV